MTDFSVIHAGVSAAMDSSHHLFAHGGDQVLMAKDIFDWADSLGLRVKQTILGLFAVGFLLGAFVTWARKGFSFGAAIAGLIGAAFGIALISQLGLFEGMFKETNKNNAAPSSSVVKVVAHKQGAGIEDRIVVEV
ncbi:hypothetical protein ACUH92_08870 [Dermabacteraceae bacterium CCM 9520]